MPSNCEICENVIRLGIMVYLAYILIHEHLMAFKECLLLTLGHTDNADVLKWEQSKDMPSY